MYVPRFNVLDDETELRALVRAVGSAELVTVDDDGYPAASLLPVIWDEGHGGYRSENVYVVTDDGCACLSDYPYSPYGD